jgi:serine/threonine-protein kinase
MGVVYRGERLGLGRAVAIKFVWPWIAEDERTRKRFEIEARAMSRLTHPSCVSVIDFGLEEGSRSPYLVMDYATGRTLGAALDAGRLPVGQALHIARQILGGLAHAHGQGIIHRDIKPDNIILSEESGFGAHVRILDFGLAKLKDTSSQVTAGFALGTPSYMSPEQTCGEPVDARSDIYAVGIVLFEMLTGQRPFRAEKALDLLKMHREVAAPALREKASEATFSAALETVVARALAKAPDARFASAAEFAAALDATPEAKLPMSSSAGEVGHSALDGTTVAGRRMATPKDAAATGKQAAAATGVRLRWRTLGVGATVIGVVAIAAWLATHQRRDPVAPSALASPAAEPAPAKPTQHTSPTPRPSASQRPPAEAETSAPAPVTRSSAVPGLDQAEALVRAGHFTAGIEALRKLRARYPDNAEVAYVMGNIYFERLWWNDGFASYRVAVSRNSAYRHDRVLILNVLKSLVSESHGGVGERFIEHEIGSAAIPYVEEAARSSSRNVSTRAARLLAKLNRNP